MHWHYWLGAGLLLSLLLAIVLLYWRSFCSTAISIASTFTPRSYDTYSPPVNTADTFVSEVPDRHLLFRTVKMSAFKCNRLLLCQTLTNLLFTVVTQLPSCQWMVIAMPIIASDGCGYHCCWVGMCLSFNVVNVYETCERLLNIYTQYGNQ